MATHILDIQQLQKFIEAMRGNPNPNITGGEFTTEQLLDIIKSSEGDLAYPPSHTDDPVVNFVVDSVRELEWFGSDPDFEEDEYDEKLYLADIKAFATLA